MTIAFLSVPTPHQAHLCKFKNSSSPIPSYPSRSILPLCSPSSTSTPVIDEEPSSSSSSSADELPIPNQSEFTAKLSGCKGCGREEIERGCNGEGRIQGGIATVPGFGWWPIKAYRPCPGFLASGGRYRRQGQNMDEVAFGRGPTTPSVAGDSKPSKKKGSQKKV